jgi:hypothetical protein
VSTQELFPPIYAEEVPAWDIGRPQPDLVAAFDELKFAGSVIDLGYAPGDLRAVFGSGYREVFIRSATFQVTRGHQSKPAWLSLFILSPKSMA